MEDNEDLCKELIELILEKPVRKIVLLHKQESVDITYESKGIRLDVYMEDESNTVYDLEMQSKLEDNLPKRARYYQGMIDLKLIEKGALYKELKKSYIIFICRKNPFEGKKFHRYIFENLCKEDNSLSLGDEAIKIFLTPEGIEDDMPEKMKIFLEFLSSGKPNDDFTSRLYQAVEKERVSKGRKKEYMTMEMFRRIERAEGREEGRQETHLSAVRGLMENLKCSAEEALRLINVPEEKRKTYLDLLAKEQ